MTHNRLLIILVLLLIFVVVWVVGNTYHNLNKSTISEETSREILPITPSFDLQTIDKLKKRKKINPIFKLERSPTPTSLQPQISSPSPRLNEESTSQEEE